MKKIAIKFIICAILLPSILFAAEREEILNLSDQVNANKEKMQKIEESINLYTQKIEEARKKSVSLQNEIGLIENQIKRAELQVEELQMTIESLELEILSITADINSTQKKIALEKDMVAYYLRELQRLQDRSPLQIIFLNKSFSQFFNEIKYIDDLQKSLSGSIVELQSLQSDLEEKQGDMKDKKEQNLKLKKDLEYKQVRLESQKTTKTVLIGQTFASESKFQALLAEAKKESEDLDADIRRMEGEIREKLRGSDLLPSEGSVVLTWPVPKNTITAQFHDPEYPYRYIYEHPGIDIRARQGTPVTAPAPGYVLKMRRSTTWRTYSYVVLLHAGGFSTVYIHLSDVYVKPDTYVKRGQVLGLSGGTPRTVGAGLFTTGPHLHFETRLNGISVNPLPYMVDL